MNKTLTAPSSLTFQFCKISITPISTQTFNYLDFQIQFSVNIFENFPHMKSESTEIFSLLILKSKNQTRS